ncbi:hypothetical protein TNCV_1651951 [Trichonephila clavipes]|nr:hypothetical protein TNCV_1651951 [Trichonephila clavipes]
MHIIYGASNGDGRAALRLYLERFPSGRMLNHKMFQRSYRPLCESNSFVASTYVKNRSSSRRQTYLEKVILDYVDETTDTRA